MTRLIDHCKQHGRITATDVQRITGYPYKSASSAIRELAAWGWFRRTAPATYVLTTKGAAWRGSLHTRIMEQLRAHAAMDIAGIAKAVGHPRLQTRRYLNKLRERGLVRHVDYGIYAEVEACDVAAE
jgi:DNA-binding IclR family transcriptional regulator